MIQSRWKSPVLWSAIFAQLLVVLKLAGIWQLVGIDDNIVTGTVAAVLQLLVLVGVLNNPTDAESW